MSRPQKLWLFASLSVALALRLVRLAFPPSPYFDEPLRFQAVQELSLGLFPTDFHAHPPLAHLFMALSFRSFASLSLSPLPRSLPFVPRDALPFLDGALLLNPKGDVLYWLPFGSLRPRFFRSLPLPCQRLFGPFFPDGRFLAVAPSSLFAFQGHTLLFRQPLPKLPTAAFLFGDRLLLLWERAVEGRTRGGQRLFLFPLPQKGTAAFADPKRGVFAVATDRPNPSLFLLSPSGRRLSTLPLPKPVRVVALLHQPSLVAPTKGWGRFLLEVLFLDGQRGRFAPKGGWRFFEFPEPLTTLIAFPDSPTLFALGANTLYLFSAPTGLLEGLVPLPASPRFVVPDRDGKDAFLAIQDQRAFLLSRPLPVFACRLAPAFFGGVLLPLLAFLFSFRRTRSFPTALLALWLVALDPLLLWLSRTLMLDMFVATFSLAAFWLAYEAKRAPSPQPRRFWLTLMGLSLGLAGASKLNGFFCLPLLFFLLSPLPLFEGVFFLFAVPALTYLAVLEIVRSFGGYSWGQLLHAHWVMVAFQTTLREVHPTAAPFWAWVLGKGSALLFHDHLSPKEGVWLFLPLPFWLYLFGLPSLFFDLHRKKGEGLKDELLMGFFGLWLLWAFSPRPTHAYFFAQPLPFLCLSLAEGLGRKRGGWFSLFSLWLLSLLWLSPTLFGFPLPLSEGHKISHPLMGWLPFFLHLLQQG